ncbi:hypothetical protein QMO31_32210, partial [Pseudomonas aeruginosa]
MPRPCQRRSRRHRSLLIGLAPVPYTHLPPPPKRDGGKDG